MLGALYLKGVAGGQAQIHAGFQAREQHEGVDQETADQVFLAGPVPETFVQAQRVQGVGLFVPGGDEGAVLAAFGPVRGDGSGAGQAHRRRIVFKLRLGLAKGGPGHVSGGLGRCRLLWFEAQEGDHGFPAVGHQGLKDGAGGAGHAQQPGHRLGAGAGHGHHGLVGRAVNLLYVWAEFFHVVDVRQ